MAKSPDPFRWFDSSPEVIRLVVMMYVRYPLSLRNVEDLLFERGIDICHETVRKWWNRFEVNQRQQFAVHSCAPPFLSARAVLFALIETGSVGAPRRSGSAEQRRT